MRKIIPKTYCRTWQNIKRLFLVYATFHQFYVIFRLPTSCCTLYPTSCYIIQFTNGRNSDKHAQELCYILCRLCLYMESIYEKNTFLKVQFTGMNFTHAALYMHIRLIPKQPFVDATSPPSSFFLAITSALCPYHFP